MWLRSAVRRLAARAAPQLAFALRLSSRRVGVALVYHTVAPTAGNTARELVPAHSGDLFAAQVRALRRWFAIVPAGALPGAVSARRRGERIPVAITFDDDTSSHAHAALAVLREEGAPATFFLGGGSLTRPQPYWWQSLQAAVDAGLPAVEVVGGDGTESIHELAARVEAMPPELRDDVATALARAAPTEPSDALTSEDLRRLVDAGMEIGFHTLRHDPLPALGDERLERALRDGREELEAAVGAPLTVLAYPHGKGDSRVAAAASAAGFRYAYTGQPVAVSADSDPHLLGRLSPSHRTPHDLILQVVRALLG